jgi:hypothetical protein
MPKISDDRLKIIIDFVKWFVVSVVLAIASTVINSRIQDREISLKELDKNDDYLVYIMKNDSLNQRLELAEYFSRVLVSERIRQRWEAYRDFLKEQKSSLRSQTDSLEKLLVKLMKNDSIYKQQLVKVYVQAKDSASPQLNLRKNELKKDSERTSHQLAEVEQLIKDNKGQLSARLNISALKSPENPLRTAVATRIDVFHLENTVPKIKEKAEFIKALLDATGAYKQQSRLQCSDQPDPLRRL